MRYRMRGGQTASLMGTATTALLLLLGLLAGPSTARGAPPPVPPSVPSRVEATPFVASEAGPRTLVARVASGYCHGAPYRPSLERVALRWRSVSATRFAAELTAFVRTPVQPPSPRAGEGPDIIQVCAGIAYDLRAKVVLPQLLARTALFDASFAPPRRMQLHGHLWFATGAFLD